jgi:Methyltransferase domain
MPLLRFRRGRQSAESQTNDHEHTASRIILDYRIDPRPRFGHDAPAHPELVAVLEANAETYREILRSMVQFHDDFRRIPVAASDDPREPHWTNGWLPQLDAMMLYATLALENPSVYLEIGSGNSTKFARRAVTDHKLRTRIVSIDPSPRAECDQLCDEIIRTPFEDVDLGVMSQLHAGDVVFLDGSHRVFTNSDTTVFFLEVLPRLPDRSLVQIHDIFLPHDYPNAWNDRYYSEQYLLASWLLGGGGGYTVHLPAYFVSLTPELHNILQPIWSDPHFPEDNRHGNSFWMRRSAAAPAG